MRKGRFSEEQMVGILREADKDPVAHLAAMKQLSDQFPRFGYRRILISMEHRARHGAGQGVASLAKGRLASAPETAAQAYGARTAAVAIAVRSQ